MKFSYTFNILACMAMGSYTLTLPTASPLLNLEITIKDGGEQAKHILVPDSPLDHSVPSVSQYTDQEQTLMKVGDRVKQPQSNDEYDQIKSGAGNALVVVDFDAVWCGPCRSIAPQFAAYSNTYSQAVFIHVDIDTLSSLPDGQDITGVPTFKFYKSGSLLTQFSGASPPKLEDYIKRNL